MLVARTRKRWNYVISSHANIYGSVMSRLGAGELRMWSSGEVILTDSRLMFAKLLANGPVHKTRTPTSQ